MSIEAEKAEAARGTYFDRYGSSVVTMSGHARIRARDIGSTVHSQLLAPPSSAPAWRSSPAPNVQVVNLVSATQWESRRRPTRSAS